MAITAYTGLPGSGKSYGVVEHVILPALKKGRHVWTNIPMNMELLANEFPSQVDLFNTEDIKNDSSWFQETFTQGSTLVLDEAWRLWPAGIKANNMEESHKSFLAEHRHMVGSDGNATEIVLVTQDLAQLAAYPRGLVETTYRAIKLNAVGQKGRFRIDIYQGAATGPNPPEKNRLRQIFGKYKAEVYQYYQSQTMSESTEHGDETQTDNRMNILNSPLFKVVIPAVVVVALFVMYQGYKALSSMYGAQDPEPVVPVDQVSAPGPVPDPAPAPVRKPPYDHFYNGMSAYIAWNMGRSPWVDYKVGFHDDERTLVLDPVQLSRMGYHIIGYDQCYLQLVGHGDTLHVYCEAQPQEEHQPIIDL